MVVEILVPSPPTLRSSAVGPLEKVQLSIGCHMQACLNNEPAVLISPSTSRISAHAMHAPLGTPERQLELTLDLVCGELIAALEACHKQGLLYKWTGACNDEKSALSMCLRKERIDRTTRNREDSKERNAKKYGAWAKAREERGETVPTRSVPEAEAGQ